MKYVLVGKVNFADFLETSVLCYTVAPPPGLPFALPSLAPRGYAFDYNAITQRYDRYVARAVKWLVHESLLYGEWCGFQPRSYWEAFSTGYWREHDPELVHNFGFAGTMTGYQKLAQENFVQFTHEGPNAITTIWPTTTFVNLGHLGSR